MTYRTLLLILSILSLSSLHAQTDNYWAWNFNTHSTLLGGSVVAGNAGPSSIYYNPSLINLENMSSLSLSANVMSIQLYDVKDIAGKDIHANEELFKVQPKFLSYTFPTKKERFGLMVALISPLSEEIRFSIDHRDTLDIISRTEGDEIYNGYAKYHRKYDDTWLGAGIAYKHSDRFSLGTSLFFSDKIMRYSFLHESHAFHPDDSVSVDEVKEPRYISTSAYSEELNYWFVSMIFKIGALYRSNNDRFRVGCNITLPDIPLLGSAEVRKTYIRSNVFNDEVDEFTENINTLAQEKGIADIRVKHPFSASLGIQYLTRNRKTSLSLTTEYFHSIDSYKMVKTSTPEASLPLYMSDQLKNDSLLTYYSQARAVLNGSFGIRHEFSDLLTYLGGFRTDFYANHSDNRYSLNYADQVKKVSVNKYHFTSGAAFQIKRLNIVTGLQYTYGVNKDMKQMINFADPLEFDPVNEYALEGDRDFSARATISEFAIFLGLEIGLSPKEK